MKIKYFVILILSTLSILAVFSCNPYIVPSFNFNPNIQNLNELDDDLMVVVGKVIFIPPIKKGEQVFQPNPNIPRLMRERMAENARNSKYDVSHLYKAFMFNFNHEKYQPPRDISVVELKASEQKRSMMALMALLPKSGVFAKPRKTFYAKVKNQSFFIIDGFITMKRSHKIVGFTTSYETHGKFTFATKRPIADTTISNLVFKGGVKVNVKPNEKAIYIGTFKFWRNRKLNKITKYKIIDDYEKENRRFIKKFGTKYKLRKSLPFPVNG